MRNARVWGLVVVLAGAGCSESGDSSVVEPTVPMPSVTAGSTANPPGSPGVAGAGAPMMGTAGAGPSVPGMGTPSQPSAGGAGTTPAMPGPGTMEPNQPGPTEPMPGGDYDYENQQVMLDADLVIAAGQTVRVGPGVTFTAKGANVKVQVNGTLIAEGTMAAPVRFLGAGMPRSWHGLVIAGGGNAQLTHVQIGGATYGIHALPGSMFKVDRSELGTSFKAAVVQSDGSFDRTKFHASGDPTFSPVNEVTIDDVNGTLTILDASPTVTNSSFDGSAALVDMIRVGGNSSPVFDHLHIVDAHCAFHANGGKNTKPKITNTVFERLGYGIMAYATKPVMENNVFRGNGYDVGFCFDATADNTPELRNNFYASGSANVDPSCFQIGADEPAPAKTANAAAGPVGL